LRERRRTGYPLELLRAKERGLNAVSPRPLKARAASGAKHFELLLDEAAKKALWEK